MAAIVQTKGQEIALTRIGPLCLLVFGRSWTDASWREFCELNVALNEHDHPPAVMVYSPHASPTSGQRRMLTEEHGERIGLPDIRYIALLSGSLVVRGALTAIEWLSSEKHRKKTKAFAPGAHAEAIAWLATQAQFDAQLAAERLRSMAIACGYRDEFVAKRLAQ